MPHVNLRVKTHAELKQTGEAARPRHQLRGHSRLGTQTQTLERAAPTGGGGDSRPAPLGTRVGGAQARSLLLLTGGSHLHPRLSHQMSPSGDGNASPAPERVPGRSRRAATPAGGGRCIRMAALGPFCEVRAHVRRSHPQGPPLIALGSFPGF